MNILDHDCLTNCSHEAQQNARKRMNHNMHTDLSDPIQRLAIAMEPETYIRPHRHAQSWELLIALRGRFIVLNFDDAGTVIGRAILGEGAYAVETPANGWHAVLSLEEGGVVFEVKHGPYVAFREEDFAPWSPSASDDHSALLAWYREAEIGQRFRA